MSNRVRISIGLVIILMLFAGVVNAQQEPRPTPTNVPADGSGSSPTGIQAAQVRGSIRGTVYQDKNADGSCSNEPILAGVPLKFVSNDGKTTVYLQSGENGTYGLVAAGLGTWSVSAEPSAGMFVTSQNPLQVFIGEEERLALGVDFCVAEGKAPGTGTVILPTAGAAVAPSLVLAGLSGIGLILAGAGIELRRRRTEK